MKIIAIIPARYEATRFPGKLMKDLCGQPLIVRTYQATLETGLFDQVLVATDSEVIKKAITGVGGQVFMSKVDHQCGSDRIAEAGKELAADIIINVQGDEPFTNANDLRQLIDVFDQDTQKEVALASLMHTLDNEEDIDNPNNVKVLVDQQGRAIYFSRSPIPYRRAKELAVTYYKHVGIYAFRKQALMDFYQSEETPLEKIEKIECLRYIEQGKKIQMLLTPHPSIGVDTPDDLDQARLRWQQKEKKS